MMDTWHIKRKEDNRNRKKERKKERKKDRKIKKI